MKCPHCLVEFHDNQNITMLGKDPSGTWGIQGYNCPNPKCKKIILYLINAEFENNSYTYVIKNDSEGNQKISVRSLIYPKGSTRPPAPIEVPIELSTDYKEACVVLYDSPKASAALSRRTLQHLLRSVANIKNGNLASEIQQVLDSNQLPSYLAESIDSIRQVGNFAAHPAKSTATGEIIDVEIGEAEWNLEVLELLFDFYYVQPEIAKQKRNALNSKLSSMGKPPMK